MSNKHDEPAFPVAISVGPNDQVEFYKGMSLRDWFAGLAMQAIINNYINTSVDWHYQVDAEQAYLFADAMLQAREQKK